MSLGGTWRGGGPSQHQHLPKADTEPIDLHGEFLTVKCNESLARGREHTRKGWNEVRKRERRGEEKKREKVKQETQ